MCEPPPLLRSVLATHTEDLAFRLGRSGTDSMFMWQFSLQVARATLARIRSWLFNEPDTT